MPLYHTEDQAMLAESVTGFMADEGGIKKQLRHYRDMNCQDGFGHALWKQFAEMGLTGMLAAEADGGLAMGVTALAGGSEDLRGRWLPGVIAGDSVLAVAIDEGPKHRPERIACKAEKAGNGFRLQGRKAFVVQGASADAIIVAARTSGSDTDTDGITLFAVPKDAAGISHENLRLVDSAMASNVTFDNVELDGDCVIGEVDGGRELLNKVLRAGRIGAAAELTGVGQGAFDITTAYLKTRKQFGQLIGEFQGLQHRAAHLYSELEIAEAAVIKAQQLLDGNSERADLMISVAKAKAAKACNLSVREGVQMHGGVGMTDEYDIGLYMKRDRSLAEFMGDQYYHAERVAQLSGY